MKCPESIEEYEELIKKLPLCRATLYEQAKARIESGVACSISEASRQIGNEVGRNPESIRRRIIEEEGVRGAHLSELTETNKYTPTNQQFRTSFTGDNEWYTPSIYIESARKVMGVIDIDPATSEIMQKQITAKTYYTLETDGLKWPWFGKLWLNPPYAQPFIYQFIEKAVNEYTLGNVTEAIILTNNFTDTAWFHLAESVSELICFTKGRIRFEKADGPVASPTQGSSFFYFGPNPVKFKDVFKRYGFVR